MTCGSSSWTLSSEEAQKWLIPIRKERHPKVRLIAFHWVGGNAYAFRSWKKEVEEGVEVFAMMLPGRLSRRHEALLLRVEEIVEKVVQSMQAMGLLGKSAPPTLFFGHSYGGLLAFETAMLLQDRDLLQVSHTIISATNSPEVLSLRSQSNDKSVYEKFHQMDDERMERELIRHGALQGGIHIDVLRLSLPIVRADFEGLETYTSKAKSQLKGCLTIWGGLQDLDNVTEDSLMGWRGHVVEDEAFSMKLFKGGHFYFMEESAKFDFFKELNSLINHFIHPKT